MYVCMYLAELRVLNCICMYVYVCLRALYGRMDGWLYVCMYVYVCMCIYIHPFVFVDTGLKTPEGTGPWRCSFSVRWSSDRRRWSRQREVTIMMARDIVTQGTLISF